MYTTEQKNDDIESLILFKREERFVLMAYALMFLFILTSSSKGSVIFFLILSIVECISGFAISIAGRNVEKRFYSNGGKLDEILNYKKEK